MIRNLSQKFGKEIIYDGLTFYSFPQVDVLAKATLRELSDCRLGFRGKYVQYAARAMKSDLPDLESLKTLTYSESKRLLLSLPGIGPKVADCILLFSLEKLGAFPVDVWIKRILCKYYSRHFPDFGFVKKKDTTLKRYEQLSSFGRTYFGEFAGYAQEYLFYYYRLNCSSGHWAPLPSQNLCDKETYVSSSAESAYLCTNEI
jgi:N-glycosylase/DNA lyase